MTNNNYVVYHLHDDRSICDSTTKFNDYIELAIQNNQNAICLTNHGNIYNWVSTKKACDKAGIKYLHGVEVYLTEKLEPKIRDNYHTILIAKNYQGVLEINKLVSISSTESHFYFKPRITFDEFFNISDNVIKISACLAGPLNRYKESSSILDRLYRTYDYYEIQYHNIGEQIEYNKKLYEMSVEYGKPLIIGTDTHSSNSYKAECRKLVQLSKGIDYGDEGDFDLTYKSYDELVRMFEIQNSLPMDIVLDAIENTNIMADEVEEFELDTSFKYPKLYNDEKQVIIKRINSMFNNKLNSDVIPKEKEQIYRDRMNEEFKVFDKLDTLGYMLFMSELICWCHDNDIATGTSRGSAGGSLIAYILDIVDIDPITWGTVFSRFMNEFRVELPDIDIDFAPNDRERVYNYIFDRFGYDYVSYILALGTVSSKGTIDLIGRTLKNNECELIYSLEKMKQIKSEFELNEDVTRNKYKDIFYYYDGIIDTFISQSMHPAGIVVSPIKLDDTIGTFYNGEGLKICQLNMDDIHDMNYVKYDILGLVNVGIIKDTCKYIGIPYPKSYNFDWNDQDVFADMITSGVGCFQFESNFAYDSLRRFIPHSIDDMSMVNAAIRPSGASFRDKLFAHEKNKNPSEIIDKLFENTYGFVLYQEQVIDFLQKICGLSGGRADNVRRAIGHKDMEMLSKELPDIFEGYCSKSDKPRNIAEEEVKVFIKILEDSSSYMFGRNHSTGYSMIGYMCAWFRYYYPLEFITAFLNNPQNSDDLSNGIALAKQKGITINNPKFRHSKDVYYFDKESNSIYKGIASIKYMNSELSKQLYDVGKTFKGSFIDLLKMGLPIDDRQWNILIDIDYFIEFGNSNQISNIYKLFNLLKKGKSKQINKNKEIFDDCIKNIIKRYSRETECMYIILDINELLSECCEYILSQDVERTLEQKIKRQIEIMGDTNIATNRSEDRFRLVVIDITNLKSKKTGEIWARKLKTISLGSGKESELTVYEKVFSSNKINKFDVIYINQANINKKVYGNFTNWYLTGYKIERKEDI